MGESFFEDFQKMWGVFYPKSGVFSGFWVVFWVGVFGLWVGVLGPWCSGHTDWMELTQPLQKRIFNFLQINIIDFLKIYIMLYK